MDVVFRGNFLPHVAAGDRWSTECDLADELARMGHRVIALQENAVDWKTVAWCAERADLFLWVQTWNDDPEGAWKTLEHLRREGVPSVAFHLDVFFGLQSRRAGWRDEPYWRVDHVFTADGGHDADFAALGINHHWSPPGIATRNLGRGTPQEVYRPFQVGFVGSVPYPHPEWTDQRRMLVNCLSASFPNRFRVWKGGLRGAALADLYASLAVVVGDSCCCDRFSRYWSDRAPETLGRGGFLIHPAIPGFDELYRDGEHLRLYQPGDLGQVVALVNHYLSHPDERREMADAGMALVASRDTYRHRLERVLDLVFGWDRAGRDGTLVAA